MDGTTGRRDDGTVGRRDGGTTGWWDDGTVGRRDEEMIFHYEYDVCIKGQRDEGQRDEKPYNNCERCVK